MKYFGVLPPLCLCFSKLSLSLSSFQKNEEEEQNARTPIMADAGLAREVEQLGARLVGLCRKKQAAGKAELVGILEVRFAFWRSNSNFQKMKNARARARHVSVVARERASFSFSFCALEVSLSFSLSFFLSFLLLAEARRLTDFLSLSLFLKFQNASFSL